jgi:hypothetical protein
VLADDLLSFTWGSARGPTTAHLAQQQQRQHNICMAYIYCTNVIPFDTKRPEYGHWDGTVCLNSPSKTRNMGEVSFFAQVRSCSTAYYLGNSLFCQCTHKQMCGGDDTFRDAVQDGVGVLPLVYSMFYLLSSTSITFRSPYLTISQAYSSIRLNRRIVVQHS